MYKKIYTDDQPICTWHKSTWYTKCFASNNLYSKSDVLYSFPVKYFENPDQPITEQYAANTKLLSPDADLSFILIDSLFY